MRNSLKAVVFAAIVAATCAPAAQYSKLGIVTAMKRLGKLEQMNEWIKQAGYWDEWLACQVFAADYPGFDAITNTAVATGLVSGEEAAAILEEAKITKSGSDEIDALILLVENNKSLREQFHGGRLGQWVVETEEGRLIKVDLYADGGAWTNGLTYAPPAIPDPERAAKRAAQIAEEMERLQAAWDAANLPPDLAALRARQREVERQNAAAEAD